MVMLKMILNVNQRNTTDIVESEPINACSCTQSAQPLQTVLILALRIG
jgi:hypothetical protein